LVVQLTLRGRPFTATKSPAPSKYSSGLLWHAPQGNLRPKAVNGIFAEELYAWPSGRSS